MRAYVTLSGYNEDADVATYTIFIPTPSGMKSQIIKIWGCGMIHYDCIRKIEKLLKEKHKAEFEIIELKSDLDIIG